MKYIFSGFYYLNDKKYYIFINKETWKKEFFTYEGNEYKPVNEEDRKILHDTFNTIGPIYFNKSNAKALVTGLYILGTLLIMPGSSKYIEYGKLQHMSYMQKVSINTPVESELKVIINSNPNLTEKEKRRVFKDLVGLCYDVPNINYENLWETVGQVDFVYCDSLPNKENTGADACYDPNTNTIYVVNGIYSNPEPHEERHCFFMNPETGGTGLFDVKRNLGRYLNEGLNSQMDKEEDGYASYIEGRYIIMTLAEIIGSDTILESAAENNLDIIINKLAELTGTYDDALSLISIIDTYGQNFREYNILLNMIGNKKYEKERDKLQRTADKTKKASIENLTVIASKLATYYKAKYGRSVEDDILVSKYLFLLTNNQDIEASEGVWKLWDATKNYFSSSAKVLEPNGVLEYITCTTTTYTNPDTNEVTTGTSYEYKNQILSEQERYKDVAINDISVLK